MWRSGCNVLRARLCWVHLVLGFQKQKGFAMKRPSSTLFNHEGHRGAARFFSFGVAITLAMGLTPAPALQAFADEAAPEGGTEVVTEGEVAPEGEEPTEPAPDELESDAIFREESAPADEPASMIENIDREEADPTDVPGSKYDPYAATSYDEIYDLLYSYHESDLQAAAVTEEEMGVVFNDEAATTEAKAADSSYDMAAAAPRDTASGAADGGYSGTNVQVEGIDEADIIKTDGAYIYRLSTEGDIYILKADGAKSKEVSHFNLGKSQYAPTGLNYSVNPSSLYVSDGKLVILRSLSYWFNEETDDIVMPLGGIEPRAGVATEEVAEEDTAAEGATDEATDETESADEADDTAAETASATTDKADSKSAKKIAVPSSATTGGKDQADDNKFDIKRFMTKKPQTALSETLTVIDIFDISDPTKPTQIYQVAQSGNANTSRMTDGVLTLMTNTYLWNFVNANKEDAATYVPSTFDNAGDTKAVSADHVYVFPSDNQYDYDNYTTVARYDIATGELKDSYALMGSFNDTYMSPSALYIARTNWVENDSDPYEDSVYTVVDSENYSTTTITRMAISNEALTLGCSATLNGYVRDQFNLDEYNGYLRVALCDDRNYSRELKDDSHDVDVYQFIESKTTNGLYVLDESMQVVGSIEDIAPGEEIKSVRFDGAVGYVCTFEEIDPLFAISLVSPTEPEILSALKIPGFSSYLHPFGEGRLLGFGQSVENNMTTGLKLSMYDTTDPANVTEIATYDIDGTYSQALYDHHAIFVSVDLGIIGVPVDEEYQLFTYTEEDGFAPYPLSDDGEALTSETLGFYGDPRGLFSGDDLYVCSDWVLVVYDITSGDLLTTVEFKDLPKQTYGPYYAM